MMDRRAWNEPFDERILCEAIPLVRQDVLSVRRGRGALVFVQGGVIWLTEENGSRDVILRQGESFRLDRNGAALVQAHGMAAVTVSAPHDMAKIEVSRAGLSVPIAAPRRRGHPLLRRILAWWLRMHRLGRRTVAGRAMDVG
jgi:Protein of unknown function (DUF2917)